MKKTYPNDEIIKSVAVGQETIEELITILVNETNEMTDDENRSPEHLRALMRKHYTVGGLSDVLSVFGPVKDDVSLSMQISICHDVRFESNLILVRHTWAFG